ncbi:hypothetical protein SISNIDRAFT_413984 [Sistotremastrum niveocremeum HHB9708]|uniref:Uncharacterized protein n=1 Tax=Sistotremastrum niveocremeum HHB9708 TaxID=1314777 RepID=A0A164SGA4_9AGAM|nr:hypothetical protein SISNIDRAFT_413984 [Sistotremastrum niveocremeum HHB9708]
MDSRSLKPPPWITFWFLLTAPVIFWTASFSLLKSMLMQFEYLAWVWRPYSHYQEIDKVGCPIPRNIMPLLNIVETSLALIYLRLVYLKDVPPRSAPVYGFSSAIMTFSKSSLFFSQQYFCNYCDIGHNGKKGIMTWLFFNGLWLVFSGCITRVLGRQIIHSLEEGEESRD